MSSIHTAVMVEQGGGWWVVDGRISRWTYLDLAAEHAAAGPRPSLVLDTLTHSHTPGVPSGAVQPDQTTESSVCWCLMRVH